VFSGVQEHKLIANILHRPRLTLTAVATGTLAGTRRAGAAGSQRGSSMAAAASQQPLALLLLLAAVVAAAEAAALVVPSSASQQLQPVTLQVGSSSSSSSSSNSFGRRLLNGGCDTSCSLYAAGGPCSRFSCQCVNGNYEVTWRLTVSHLSHDML
jgi:hypothetical protein